MNTHHNYVTNYKLNQIGVACALWASMGDNEIQSNFDIRVWNYVDTENIDFKTFMII